MYGNIVGGETDMETCMHGVSLVEKLIWKLHVSVMVKLLRKLKNSDHVSSVGIMPCL